MSCAVCAGPIRWVDCPTGGWWAHETHPSDGHDAVGPESIDAAIARALDLLAIEPSQRTGADNRELDGLQKWLQEHPADQDERL